jgi:hypothetical protein
MKEMPMGVMGRSYMYLSKILKKYYGKMLTQKEF